MSAFASPATEATAPARRGGGPVGVPVTRPLLLCVVGALAAAATGTSPPAGMGAARLADPSVVLAVLDTVWLLLVAWPGRRSWSEALVLLALGAPFHAALAGAAAAGTGHLIAWGLMLGGWALVAAAVGRGLRYAACLGVAAVVLPLTGYGLREFLSLDALDAVLASPLTGPTLLARDAPSVTAAAAVPALLVEMVVLIACLVPGGGGEEAP